MLAKVLEGHFLHGLVAVPSTRIPPAVLAVLAVVAAAVVIPLPCTAPTATPTPTAAAVSVMARGGGTLVPITTLHRQQPLRVLEDHEWLGLDEPGEESHVAITWQSHSDHMAITK